MSCKCHTNAQFMANEISVSADDISDNLVTIGLRSSVTFYF